MAVINGTEGGDFRTGSDRDDRISGLGGNDTLFGNAGRDIISGGNGDDTIDGGVDFDTLNGDAGRDVLTGGGGRDFIDGGTGVDTARFSGRSTDYRISQITKDSYFVADLRSALDDTDEVKGVERLYFAGNNSTIYLTANKAPVAGNDFGSGVENSGAPVTGTVLANDSDADLDPFSVTAVRTGPQGAGGTSGSVGLPLAGAYGSLALDAQGNYSYVINNANAAVNALNVGQSLTDFFTYTISDGIGGTGQATLSITVNGVNDAPVAIDDTGSATEGEVVVEEGGAVKALAVDNGGSGSNATGNVLVNDTDVDGPFPLVVSALRTGTEAGEGTTGTVGTGLTGAYGTLTLNADGSYTYVVNNANAAVIALNAGGTLVDDFTYTAADGYGAIDRANLAITINGANDAPVANNDTGSATETGTAAGSNASGNVLTNDTDVDSTPLSVSSVRTGAEGDTGTAGTVGTGLAGTYGTLTLNSDGSYGYAVNNANAEVNALNSGDVLQDTFTYSVSDGAGGTDQATLAITINGADDELVPTGIMTFDDISLTAGSPVPDGYKGFSFVGSGSAYVPDGPGLTLNAYDYEPDGDLEAFNGFGTKFLTFSRSDAGDFSILSLTIAEGAYAGHPSPAQEVDFVGYNNGIELFRDHVILSAVRQQVELTPDLIDQLQIVVTVGTYFGTGWYSLDDVGYVLP